MTSPMFESEYDREDYYRRLNREIDLMEYGMDVLYSWDSDAPRDGVAVILKLKSSREP